MPQTATVRVGDEDGFFVGVGGVLNVLASWRKLKLRNQKRQNRPPTTGAHAAAEGHSNPYARPYRGKAEGAGLSGRHGENSMRLYADGNFRFGLAAGDWVAGHMHARRWHLRRFAFAKESATGPEEGAATSTREGVASAIVCDGVSTAAVVFAPEYGNEDDHQIRSHICSRDCAGSTGPDRLAPEA